VWLNAQNTDEKCSILAGAFGIGSSSLGPFQYGCLQVGKVGSCVPGDGPTGQLLCSFFDGCPDGQRTLTEDGYQAICPCV
jgi:hypothetical protein